MKFEIDPVLILDLRDDIVMNYDKHLYEFLGKNVLNSFYFGLIIKKIYSKLEAVQQYLYSKELRHLTRDIEQYASQIQYWTKKNKNSKSLIESIENIYNNIIWFPNSEDEDKVKVALFLAGTIESAINENEILPDLH